MTSLSLYPACVLANLLLASDESSDRWRTLKPARLMGGLVFSEGIRRAMTIEKSRAMPIMEKAQEETSGNGLASAVG